MTISITRSFKMKYIVFVALFATALAASFPPQQKGVACDMCKFIVNAIEEQVLNEQTEQQILDYMNTACDQLDQIMPGLSTACHNFVNNNLKKILDDLIENHMTPEEVCIQLKLCKA